MGRYTFQLCTDAQTLLEAYRVRVAVFHEEQGFGLDEEVDQLDPISAHFILRDEQEQGTVVGVIRLVPYPYPAELPARPSDPGFPIGQPRSETDIAAHFTHGAKLGRLAAVKSARGAGLGKRLVLDAEAWLASVAPNGLPLRLSAQMYVVPFYQK